MERNPFFDGIIAYINIWLIDFVGVYDDTFFESLDGVTNALDNVDASKFQLHTFLMSY